VIEPVQIIALLASLFLLGLVLELVRRKKLTEEYSFVWLVCALALLVVALGRRLFLDRVALAMGIYYPPAALLLVLIFFVFVASLSFSVVVSRQRQQIERLIEETALLEARLRELHDPSTTAQTRQRDYEKRDATH
jgi:hypothetical protein